MKRILTIVLIVLLGLGIIGFLIFRGRQSLSRVTKPTPTPEQKVIETPLVDRPYVSLTPRADGRELTLEINRIKSAQTIEYELSYLSGDLSRGVIGSIELKNEEMISRKLLLGSCSRNVCKYDENVSEGSLILRFRGPDGVRKFITDFHLQLGKEKLTSLDGNFKLEGKLSAMAYYLTMPTIGLPGEIKGAVAGQPYGVFTAGSTSVKNAKVTLAVDGAGKIYAWTGKDWQELKDSTTSQLTTFIAALRE